MTIARDPKTGAAAGQVIDRTPQLSLDRDPKAQELLLLLTRDGRYVTVPAHSVRLEEV